MEFDCRQLLLSRLFSIHEFAEKNELVDFSKKKIITLFEFILMNRLSFVVFYMISLMCACTLLRKSHSTGLIWYCLRSRDSFEFLTQRCSSQFICCSTVILMDFDIYLCRTRLKLEKNFAFERRLCFFALANFNVVWRLRRNDTRFCEHFANLFHQKFESRWRLLFHYWYVTFTNGF